MEKSTEMLSIVVPCYNESKAIEDFHGEVKKQLAQLNSSFDYEIIYVNDGSTDDSAAKIRAIAADDEKVKFISFSRNFGKESAMLAGLEHMSGDCVIIMDSDLQHPPELIHEMLEKYQEGYDQVIARRNRKGESLKSRMGAGMYYKFVNKMIDIKLVDGAGDFRLLSRKAVEAVLSLKETNRFSKGLFTWVGFRQTYIEYENRLRSADSSRWTFKSLLKYAIDGIVSFNIQPLRLCVYMGGILLLLSMAYLVYLLISIIINGVDVPGYFTTIAMISVIGGVQLISLGIIGEYIGRIYAEVKQRPAYIIEESDMKGKTENGKA